MNNYIDVRNVTKKFNGKIVLDNVTFAVSKGEIFGLIGPNGAGKTTLIKIITGLLAADNGQISVAGHPVKGEALAAKRKMGLVPQELALIEAISAYDNLEFFGSLYGLKGKILRDRIVRAMEFVGLGEKRRMKVKKFSGGMKRRLNLAAAIMHEPEILILDEPTVGIDPQSRNHIFNFIKEVNREKETTVLYTSHYMEEVEYLCNTIFIIDEGKEIAYGSQQSVKSLISNNNRVSLEVEGLTKEGLAEIEVMDSVINLESDHNKVNLLVDADNFRLEPLLKVLESNEFIIKAINVEEPNLEEVFLSLTGKSLRN